MGFKEHEKILFTMCWTFRKVMWPRQVYACFRKIIPYKQFVYYLKKWEEFGFYDYGVNQELGWFYPENFPDRYKEIIEGVEDFKECKTGCVF